MTLLENKPKKAFSPKLPKKYIFTLKVLKQAMPGRLNHNPELQNSWYMYKLGDLKSFWWTQKTENWFLELARLQPTAKNHMYFMTKPKFWKVIYSPMGIADRSERSSKNLKDMQEFTLIFRLPHACLGWRQKKLLHNWGQTPFQVVFNILDQCNFKISSTVESQTVDRATGCIKVKWTKLNGSEG